eukprot:6083006-Amphidinium_carterae.1
MNKANKLIGIYLVDIPQDALIMASENPAIGQWISLYRKDTCTRGVALRLVKARTYQNPPKPPNN